MSRQGPGLDNEESAGSALKPLAAPARTNREAAGIEKAYRQAARIAHQNISAVTEGARVRIDSVAGVELGAWVDVEVLAVAASWPEELQAERVRDGLWRIYVAKQRSER